MTRHGEYIDIEIIDVPKYIPIDVEVIEIEEEE